jgi:hypothetical protein
MLDIPAGYRRNAAGDLVAEVNIKPEHKLEDELVTRLAARAAELSEKLAAFRADALAEIYAYRDLIAAEYGAKLSAGGNMTLTAFDGSLQVQLAVAKSITFGPELQAAKALIDQCVTRWSEGANDNLRTLVFDAFQTDRQGKISTDKVLGLRRLAIEDEDWKQAMEAISNAVRVTGSKTYVRFYRRTGDALEPITLDLANAGGPDAAS